MTNALERRIRLGGGTRTVALTFLDCDGVIFDSNLAKQRAFAHALADYPHDAVERLLEIHRIEGGVSRYVKLRRFFEEIHPVRDPEPAIARALERFGAASRAAYAELAPLPEALAFADAMGAPASVVVVSGSDQDELVDVFARHGILDRFAAVLGSPATKPEHLRRVLAERHLPPDRALMVGDGKGDLDCAVELGVGFVFLEARSEWKGGAAATEAAGGTVARTWAELRGRVVGS